MNATLYEVISMGNIIQKCYYLDSSITLDNKEVENLIIEYNQEQLNGQIIDPETDETLSTLDLEFYDKSLTFDVEMDKHILSDYFYNTKVTIEKECDDYPELYE
jgi:hypothetical protein